MWSVGVCTGSSALSTLGHASMSSVGGDRGTVVVCTVAVEFSGFWSMLHSFAWRWSICFSCVDKVKSAFRTGSPADRLGVVVEGGFVKMSTMSVAAWCRKSRVLMCGKGVACGKKFTVSQSRVERVFGK